MRLNLVAQRWMAAMVLAAGVVSHAPGQEVPPLLLDDKRPQIRVRTATPKPDDSAEPAKPTPSPEDVIVALVNGRVLTRAEVDARVSTRYEGAIARVQSRMGGVLGTFNPGQDVPMEVLGEQELLEEQKEDLEAAMREEEGLAIQDWIEFAMLAEEARRQGMIVSDGEFKDRLAQLEEQHQIDGRVVEEVLAEMRMTRSDYERSIYDALLIEKMLGLFISLNYSEQRLRAAYDSNPAMFKTPARHRVAHFTIALEPTTTRRHESEMRALARRLQTLLKKGDAPEVVFRLPEFERPDEGVLGEIPGWYTFHENTLPQIVEWHGRRMKLGDVSDIIENKARDDDGKIYIKSLHVIKLVEFEEARGETFESALPVIHERMIEVARRQVLDRLDEAGSHKVIVNVGGIRPGLIPTREQLIALQAKAQPISLKLPQDKPAQGAM